MEFNMSDIELASNKAQMENVTRRLLYVVLGDLGIDQTSKLGLHVIDHFRIPVTMQDEVTAYTEDDVYDYIERMDP